MDCKVTRDMLDSLLDGELDPAPRAEVEAHLAACEACRARARAETRVRARIAALAASEAAPAGLRERLTAVVHGTTDVSSSAAPAVPRISQPGPARTDLVRGGARRPVPAWAYALASAASLAALVLVWSLVSRGGVEVAMAAGLAEDHRDHHGDSGWEAIHLETDPAELARWLESHTGMPVRLPPPPASARLVGGQICIVEGERVAHAVYETGGETVSYYVMSGAAERRQSRGSVEGLNYVAWGEPSHRVVVLGSVPERELARFADS